VGSHHQPELPIKYTNSNEKKNPKKFKKIRQILKMVLGVKFLRLLVEVPSLN
jgi:hypothetical protein